MAARGVRIEGALAVVTGAGSGIGRATALALGAAGAKVVAADVDAVSAARTAGDCGGWAEVFDVADADAVGAAAGRVLSAHGSPDLLVNNAGVGMTGGFLDTGVGDWEWIVGVNLLGVVAVTAAFAPGMVARGSGQVVNVSSGLAYTPRATEPAYVSTKAAVLALSHCLRADLHRRGVGVSVVCPGIVATSIVTSGTRFLGERSDPAARRRVESLFARGHRPEKVADAIVGAARTNRSVAPVGFEARLGWYLRRLLPQAAVDLAARSAIGAL